MEIRRTGQGPEALKEQRGWMDHSWTGSKVTATCNISPSGGQRAGKDKLSFKTSSQTHLAEL